LQYENAQFELLALDKDEIRYSQFLESGIFVYRDRDIIAFCTIYGSEIRTLFVHSKARGKDMVIKLLEFMPSKINGTAILYVAA